MTTSILILGVTGMLGSCLYRSYSKDDSYSVFGTTRRSELPTIVSEQYGESVFTDLDAFNIDQIRSLLSDLRPSIVINCIGIVKQLAQSNERYPSIYLNSYFPHALAKVAADYSARVIHISTDCVFAGSQGMYLESDQSDALDLYGKTKYLGEVDYPNAITLRTSIIGHELDGSRSLVDWFLSQKSPVRGYTNAIFSGFPTVTLAKIIKDYVFKNVELHGLYHLSAEPIDKFSLLSKISKIYGHKTEVMPFGDYQIDRSLDSSRFRSETGFEPEGWDIMLNDMYADFRSFN